MILLHEFDHWIKRYICQGDDLDKAITERETINKQDYSEGGEILFIHLFGKQYFLELTCRELCFILNKESWNLEYNKFNELFNQFNIDDLSNYELFVDDFIMPTGKDRNNVFGRLYGKAKSSFGILGKCYKPNYSQNI